MGINLFQDAWKSILVCFKIFTVFLLELVDYFLLDFTNKNIKVGFMKQKLLDIQTDYIITVQMFIKGAVRFNF